MASYGAPWLGSVAKAVRGRRGTVMIVVGES